MRIELASPEADEAYIRYARAETLKSLGGKPNDINTAPSSKAVYVVAYDDTTDSPIGLAESAMARDFFQGYDEAPGAEFNLDRFCPFHQMAGTRTIFSEPEYRGKSPIFLALMLASAKIFYGFGARFATVNTSRTSDYLKRLYTKSGAVYLGDRVADGLEAAYFLFDVEHLVNHRTMRRIAPLFAFDETTVSASLP